MANQIAERARTNLGRLLVDIPRNPILALSRYALSDSHALALVNEVSLF